MPSGKERKPREKSGKRKPSAQSGPPEIPFTDIVFDEKKDFIGEGAFGKVYKAKLAGKYVACKFPIKSTLSEAELKSFRNEVHIMRKIFHPNVVLFLGACTDPGHLAIITELLKTDLEHVLDDKKWQGQALTLTKRMHWARDAALGMSWLHTVSNIIHRDLKPANLLIDENERVKVTDFGFSRSLKSGQNLMDMKGPKGTALYMAPEVLMQEEFNHTIDVYAWGLILWELVTLEELFSEFSDLEPFVEAVCFDQARPPMPKTAPTTIKKLLSSTLDHDKDKRPSFEKVAGLMDRVCVEVVVKLKPAQDFWIKHFVIETNEFKSQVPWKDFSRTVTTATGFKHNLDALKSFFTDGGEVTLDKFNLATRWFGYFFDKQHGAALLKEMVMMFKQPITGDAGWFHGEVSKDEAVLRLKDQPEGTLLIRLSTSDPDKAPFAISRAGSGGSCQHVRITRLKYDFEDGPQFACNLGKGIPKEHNSLFDMISALKKQKKTFRECPYVAGNVGDEYGQALDDEDYD